MKIKAPQSCVAPSSGRLMQPGDNPSVGGDKKLMGAERGNISTTAKPRTQNMASVKGLRQPLNPQNILHQPSPATRLEIRSAKKILNQIITDPSVGPSFDFSIKNSIPYFFIVPPESAGRTQINDAEEYFAEHEVDRIIASNKQPLYVLPHSGTLFLAYKKGQSPVLYNLGILNDLEKHSHLFDLIVDMTTFTYYQGQDKNESQIVARSCAALAFRFGEIVRRDTAFAALLVRDLEPASAKYGFAIAMLHAVALGRPDMVAFCLDSGGTPLGHFRPNAEELGPAPIERAVSLGHTYMVEMMLRKITVEEGRQWLPRLFSEERGWSKKPAFVDRLLAKCLIIGRSENVILPCRVS